MSLTDNSVAFKSDFPSCISNSDGLKAFSKDCRTTDVEPEANIDSVSKGSSKSELTSDEFAVIENPPNEADGTYQVPESEQPSSSSRASDGNACQQDNEGDTSVKNRKPKYNCLVPKEMWSQEMVDLYAQQKKVLKEYGYSKDRKVLMEHRRLNYQFKNLLYELRKKIVLSDKYEEIQELAKISKEKETIEKNERMKGEVQRHLVNKAKMEVLGPNFIENYVNRGHRLSSYMRESDQFKEFVKRYSLDSFDPEVVPKLIDRLKESGELHLLESKARYNYLKFGRSSFTPRRCQSPSQRERSPLRMEWSSHYRKYHWNKDEFSEKNRSKTERKTRSNSSDNSSVSHRGRELEPKSASDTSSKLTTETTIESVSASNVDVEKSVDRPRLPSLLDDIVQLRESIGDNAKPASVPKLFLSAAPNETRKQSVDSAELSSVKSKISAQDFNSSSSREKSCHPSKSQHKTEKPIESGTKQNFRQGRDRFHNEQPNASHNYNVNVSCDFNFSMSVGYHMNGGCANNRYNQGFGMGYPCAPYGPPYGPPYDGGYYGGHSGYPCPYPGPSNYPDANEIHFQNSLRYPSSEMHYSGVQESYYDHKGGHEDRALKSKHKKSSSRNSNDDSRNHHSSSRKKSCRSPKHGESTSRSSNRRHD